MKHEENITRFDFGRTHGWWVRFERSGNPIRKLFSDRRYGGRTNAFKEARAFRDSAEVAAKIIPPQCRPGQGRIFIEVRSYRTRTGELLYYQTWSAWIRVNGRPRHTSYSISKHGSQEAKRMAKKWLHDRRGEARA